MTICVDLGRKATKQTKQTKTASCEKVLSVKHSLLLKIKKNEKYRICVMDLIRHQEITLILFGFYLHGKENSMVFHTFPETSLTIHF